MNAMTTRVGQRLNEPCSMTGLQYAGVLANAIQMANAVRQRTFQAGK
jgi:hypothetical protein